MEPEDLDWDLVERNALLDDGTLLNENAPTLTTIAVAEDE